MYEKLGAKLIEVSCRTCRCRSRRTTWSRRPSARRTWRASTACASAIAARTREDLMDLYKRSRGEGFGAEVKRRIMIGTYVLSAGYYDAYYLRAQKVRRLISRRLRARVPRSRRAAWARRRRRPRSARREDDDPVAMYLNDIYTIGANLAGLPGDVAAVRLRRAACRSACSSIGAALRGRRRCSTPRMHYQRDTDWHRRCPRRRLRRNDELGNRDRPGDPRAARDARARSSPAPRPPTAPRRTRRRASSISAIRACCPC